MLAVVKQFAILFMVQQSIVFVIGQSVVSIIRLSFAKMASGKEKIKLDVTQSKYCKH